MSRLIASGLGVGHLRPAPGTWGSAATVALLFALALVSPILAILVVLLSIPLAHLSIATAIPRDQGHQDPGWIVIDEVAGQGVALLPVLAGIWHTGAAVSALWPGWVAAFLLFRLFDVWKPGPVGWADRRPGAAGVLLDDVIAGAIAAIGVVALAALAHLGLMR